MSKISQRKRREEKDREKWARAEHRERMRERGELSNEADVETPEEKKARRASEKAKKRDHNQHAADCMCNKCFPKRTVEMFQKLDETIKGLFHDMSILKSGFDAYSEITDTKMLSISEDGIKDVNALKKATEISVGKLEDAYDERGLNIADDFEAVRKKVTANKKEIERIENSAMKLIQDQKKQLDDYHTELIKLAKYVGNIYKFLQDNYKAQLNEDGTITKKG